MDLETGTNELLAQLDEGIAWISFNRPEKRNALSDQLTPALRAILLELEADTRVRVIVITGVGKAFCAGGDVSGMGANKLVAKPSALESVRRLQHRQETLTLRLHELTKPTIAALPGPAVGAGLAIALACDLRISAQSAFVATGYARIGLSGDYGVSWLMTQLIGTAKTRELFFTGRRVASAEALSLGLVNSVVPDAQLREQTQTLARSIAAGPPLALSYMKENLNRAMTEDLRTCLALEADRLIRCAATADHKEAVDAFLTKRTPIFSGT
jgi:2-(1,2-epoxy-1,2-dihydrophenyl)acetyl-CoA isomerase